MNRQYTGTLTSVDVMVKPSPIATPGGKMLTVEQSATLAWDFEKL